MLASDCRQGLEPPPTATGSDVFADLLCRFSAMGRVSPELLDESGARVPLRSDGGTFNKQNNHCWSYWIADRVPTGARDCTVLIMNSTNQATLAVIRLGG